MNTSTDILRRLSVQDNIMIVIYFAVFLFVSYIPVKKDDNNPPALAPTASVAPKSPFSDEYETVNRVKLYYVKGGHDDHCF